MSWTWDHAPKGVYVDTDARAGKALETLAKGQQAQMVFRFLEEYLVGRQRQLDTELFATDDPVKQGYLLAQKREAHLFIRNLTYLMKSGEAAGRILQPMMDEALISNE